MPIARDVSHLASGFAARLAARVAFVAWAAAFAFATPADAQQTRRVPATYATIQAAIDAAGNGDAVVVSPGRYAERIDFKGKAVTVRSTGGYAVTTIDGGGVGPVVRIATGEPASARLEGFTVRGGVAVDGGGVFVRGASPTLVDNLITENAATNRGGGLFLSSATPIVRGNIILDNASALNGGGVHTDGGQATIDGNTIALNVATLAGGGLYLDGGAPVVSSNGIYANRVNGLLPGYGAGIHGERSAAVVRDNLITTNTISSAQSQGGGICCFEGSMRIDDNEIVNNAARSGAGIDVTNAPAGRIVGNEITLNRAIQGGGVRCMLQAPAITGNTIARNIADEGGGVSLDFGASPIMVNNLVWANTAQRGAGLHLSDRASPRIVNSSIVGNTAIVRGGAIHAEGSITGPTAPTVQNAILWNNRAPNAPEIALGANAVATVGYSVVRGGYAGTGNVNADPRFVDEVGGDLHLAVGSPCLGAGDPGASSVPSTDFEGDARGGAIDLGADQRAARIYAVGTLERGRTFELRVVGPASSPTFLGLSARLLPAPFPIPGVGTLRIDLTGVSPVAMGTTNAAGFLRLPIPVPQGVPPLRLYGQAIVGGTLTANAILLDLR